METSQKDILEPVLANYHTHSVFCDGSDTLEELAKVALQKGFKYLGFSSHSAFPFTTGTEMHPSKFTEYFETIEKLKTEFSEKLEILAGLEIDYLPPISFPDYSKNEQFPLDYIIGSVHFVCNEKQKESGVFAVDNTTEEVLKGLKTAFNGDAKLLVQTYFETQKKMLATCDFDVIGHIDLVRKRNSELKMFSEDEPWYKREITSLAKEIAKSNVLVEINTGGMARKAIDSPYPTLELLQILRKHDVPIILSSDAHKTEHLDFAFEQAAQLAKSAGYDERYIITKSGVKACKFQF